MKTNHSTSFRFLCRFIESLAVTCWIVSCGWSAEQITLDATHWDSWVPAGKEVDCIYGDIVLRNDRMIAVIAQPIAGRHANMTTKNIGGGVIDLTSRTEPNDQLTVFMPGASQFNWQPIESANATSVSAPSDVTELVFRAVAVPQRPAAELIYRLRDGDPFLAIEIRLHNPHSEPIAFSWQDGLRADRSFDYRIDPDAKTFAAHDSWWRQSYGLVVADRVPVPVRDTLEKRRPISRIPVGGRVADSVISW